MIDFVSITMYSALAVGLLYSIPCGLLRTHEGFGFGDIDIVLVRVSVMNAKGFNIPKDTMEVIIGKAILMARLSAK